MLTTRPEPNGPADRAARGRARPTPYTGMNFAIVGQRAGQHGDRKEDAAEDRQDAEDRSEELHHVLGRQQVAHEQAERREHERAEPDREPAQDPDRAAGIRTPRSAPNDEQHARPGSGRAPCAVSILIAMYAAGRSGVSRSWRLQPRARSTATIEPPLVHAIIAPYTARLIISYCRIRDDRAGGDGSLWRCRTARR